MPLIAALIAAVATFVVTLTLFLSNDLAKWKKGIPVDHGGKTVLRRLPLQLPSVVLFAVYAQNFWAAPVAYLMMNFWWWEWFDGLYNQYRNLRWRYNGSFNDPGHTDAWTDKLLKSMEPWQQAVLKWGLIAASTFAYILLIK